MVAMVASAAMASSIRATSSISSGTSRIHVVLSLPVEASAATDRKGACQARMTPGKLRTSGSRRQAALVVSAMSRRESENVQGLQLLVPHLWGLQVNLGYNFSETVKISNS